MAGNRRRRRLLLLLAVLALLVAFAPRLLGTGFARDFVAGRVGDSLGRPVELEGLEAGWFSGISVRGLRVRNASPEFRAAPLMEARSVRVESTLLGLLFGAGAERIVVEGLVLRLEEHAGGRTNVDDLWARLAAPPGPPAEKREPPPPLRLHLVDASIHVRRLLRRPQPRPFDPFREDPVILDAGEGLLVFGLEDLDLRLESTPLATSIDLESAIRLGESTGRADVSLRLGPDGPSGSVVLEGIDLALLRPFVPGAIAGRLDLVAKSSAGGAGFEVDLLARDVHLDGPALPPIDEEWLRLKGRVRRADARTDVDDLSLNSASGALRLEGGGSWPPPPDTPFQVVAHAPAAMLGLDAAGLVHLEAHATEAGEGIDVGGTLYAPELVLAGHEGASQAGIRFDVGIMGERLALRSVLVRAQGIDLGVSGEVELSGPFAADLRGHADLDLDRAEHFLPLRLRPEGATVEGRLRVPRFELQARAGGELELKVEGELADFVAHGLFEEDLRIARSEIHVDAAVAAGGDLLHVAEARLDELRASGTIEGLAGHRQFRAEGAIGGALELNPLHARLAGLGDVTGLGGRLTVDVRAATDRTGTRVEGSASVAGLHVTTAAGAWDLPQLSAAGQWHAGGEAHAGEVTVRGDGFSIGASLEDQRARVEADVEAVERQPLLMRFLDLPPDVTLAGPVILRADADLVPGAWRVGGTLASAGLTAQKDGRGLSRAPLSIAFRAREEADGWTVAVPDAALPDLGAKLRLEKGVVRDGSLAGHVHLEGPLDRLASLAPEAARHRPTGTLAVDAQVAREAGWTIGGELKAQDATGEFAGRRGPPSDFEVKFNVAIPGDGTAAVNYVRLRTETTELVGAGAIGARRFIRLQGRTCLEEWLPYVAAPPGRGEIVVDELALEVFEDGRLLLTETFAAKQLSFEHARLGNVTARSRIEGRLVDGAVADLKVDVTVAAASAQRSNIRAENLVVREKGSGRWGDYRLDADLVSDRVRIDEVVWEGVALKMGGRLQDLLERRELAGLAGEIAFRRWKVGPVLWENGRADLALEDGAASVSNLEATVHGGRVRATGRLAPGGGRLAWQGAARAEGIVLSRQLGRPLSFLVPFLNVGDEGALSGRADVELSLAADDTTDAAILQTLHGEGSVHLYGIEVRNSLLLPLLGLRLDTILRRSPYRFDDLTVRFAVGRGAVRPERFELEAKPFGISARDIEVGLDGSIEATLVPSIFVPLRVSGTLDDPKVRPAPFGRLLR